MQMRQKLARGARSDRDHRAGRSGGVGAVQPRLERTRRRVLPVRRERRLRRRPLHPQARLRPRHGCARRPRDRERDGNAGAEQLRPRPARTRGRERVGRRPARDVPARRPGADRHPGRAARRRLDVRRQRQVRRRPGGHRRPGRLDRGLDPDRRRRVRRQRAAGLAGWYPANDNPRDKATFDFRVTVPRGQGRARQRRPEVPQDAQGQDDLALDPGRADGAVPRRPRRTATSRRTSTRPTTACRCTWRSTRRSAPARTWRASRDIIDLFSELYGAYPFSAAGGIADNAGFVGYALETQTKANYANNPSLEHDGARGRARVVRQRGDADRVEGHLAQRGLRALVGVDLDGEAARRHARGDDVPRQLQQPAAELLDPATRERRRAARSCSATRPTGAAR